MNFKRLFRWASALAFVFSMDIAQAVVTCTVSSAGVSTSYDVTASSDTIVQGQVTATCTAGAAGDLGAFSYSIGANNGLYSTAGKPRAALGTNYVTYDTWVNSSCSALWKATPAASARLPSPAPGTLTLASVGVPVSATTNYWACIPFGQTGATPGLHSDTITMTLYSGTSNTSLATGTLPVSINVPGTCSISTPPGTVALTYTSFGAAANASTTYGVTCTNGQTYTMSLSPTSGTLLGLNYTVGLSASGGTGNGGSQTYTVTGSISAGQSGTCSASPPLTCNATAPHTLTITFN